MSWVYAVDGRIVTEAMLEAAIADDRAAAQEREGRHTELENIRERWIAKREALRRRLGRMTRRERARYMQRLSCEHWLTCGQERFYERIDHDIRMWDIEQARKLGVRSVLEDDLRDERLECERRKILVRDFARRGIL